MAYLYIYIYIGYIGLSMALTSSTTQLPEIPHRQDQRLRQGRALDGGPDAPGGRPAASAASGAWAESTHHMMVGV